MCWGINTIVARVMCLGFFTKETVFYSFATIPQRYVFATFGFLCMVAAYSMRSCFNIAIIKMVRPVVCPLALNQTNMICPFTNSTKQLPVTTLEMELEYFDWDEKTQGMILSSFYYGYILTHIPGGALAQRIGGKHTLGIGILSTSILTLLTPWAAYKGSNYLMALRFFEGVGEGAKFPAMSHLLAQWAPPLERSKMSTFVFSGALIGLLAGVSLGGIIIEWTGQWENVFFTFGTVGTVWFVAWLFFGSDNPSSHPLISDEERRYLMDTIGQLERKKDLGPTPWREMIKSGALWSLVVAEFGHDWAAYLILTDLPKYMSDVIHFTVAENGILSSLPSLLSWFVSLASSWSADWILERQYMSITAQRKLYAAIGSVGPAIALIIVSYVGCDQFLVVTVISLGLGLMGFCFPSLKVNTIDLSPNYSATIMALANGGGCLAGMFAPYTVGLLTPNRTVEEWRVAFLIMAAMLILSNFAFLLFGSAEVQYWNDMNEHRSRTRQEIDRAKILSDS